MFSLELQQRPKNMNPRQMRSQGLIPVTVYGRSLPTSLSLVVSTKEFTKVGISRFSRVFTAVIDKKPCSLILKSIESNPVTDEILNIQLHYAEPDQQVKITIPLIYDGSSPLVQAGGTLFINKKSIDLICPTKLIPAAIHYQLNELKDSKHIAYYYDLVLPEGVLLRSDKSQIIAKISMPSAAPATAA